MARMLNNKKNLNYKEKLGDPKMHFWSPNKRATGRRGKRKEKKRKKKKMKEEKQAKVWKLNLSMDA